MSLVQILVIAGVVWVVLAIAVAMAVGGVIRNRDRQVPQPEPDGEPAIPEQRGPKPRRRPQQWPYSKK